MSLANLAAGFLQGFTQSRIAKDEREQEGKKNKLLTQLMELQLQNAETREAATQKVMELLTPSTMQANPAPVFQEPTGPLDPFTKIGERPGPTATRPGMTLIELLADPEGSIALLQSGMLGDVSKLQSEQSRAAMQERMFNMLSAGGGSPAGMELSGLSFDTSGNVMPDFRLPQITTQTIETPEGPRIQSINARTGEVVADLGPVGQEITVEESGRIQGLFGAQQTVSDLKAAYLNPDGSVNRRAVLLSFGPGVPLSEGRKISAQFEDAADAVIRARTGATANKEELQGIADQFKPHPLDDDATIIDKLDRFERFSAGALDIVTLPPRLRELAEKMAPQGIEGAEEFQGFEIVE